MKLSERLKFLRASSPGRKRTLFWALKFGALFVVFLIFLLPAHRDYSLATSQVTSLREQTAELKKVSVNLLTPDELQETEQHIKEFESKLIHSAHASTLLDFISNEADKNHLNVVQIYSDSPVTVRDETNKDIEFKGKKLMLLPVNFRMETDFKNLGNFLKSLQDNIKGNCVVESLALKKASPQLESLQCDITLVFVVT